MKKKTISILLSTLCIICIGVFAPFSAYAEDESNLTANLIRDLYTAQFDNQGHTYSSDISDSFINYFDYIFSDKPEITGNLPNYKFFDGTQVINYSIADNDYQFFMRFTMMSVTEYNEYDMGYLELNNRRYSANIGYIDIAFDDGAVYHYRIKGDVSFGYYNDYVAISFRNATLWDVANGEIKGTGYSTSYQLYYDNNNRYVFDFIPDLYSTTKFLQGFGTSTSGSQSWSVYPNSEYLALCNMYSHFTNNSDFSGSASTTNVRNNKFYCVYAESNDIEMNNRITAQPNTNTIYYYNNTFKKGDVFNENMIQQITDNRNNRLPKYYDENTSGGGGWNSPDYPVIDGTAVIQPSLVEFSTSDIPSNLMEVGTSFLSESLKVVDVIPNYMLCLGILFMVWVCFHIFGK